MMKNEPDYNENHEFERLLRELRARVRMFGESRRRHEEELEARKPFHVLVSEAYRESRQNKPIRPPKPKEMQEMIREHAKQIMERDAAERAQAREDFLKRQKERYGGSEVSEENE